LLGAFVAAVGFLAGVARAHAEPSADDKTLATMLFQEGGGLLSHRRADAISRGNLATLLGVGGMGRF